MHLFFGNILTAAFCQKNLQFPAKLCNRLHPVGIYRHNSASSPVYLHISFLLQDSICFVDRVHIDSDLIRKLSDRRELFTLSEPRRGNAQNNLIAKLQIQRLIAVKINLNNHAGTTFLTVIHMI